RTPMKSKPARAAPPTYSSGVAVTAQSGATPSGVVVVIRVAPGSARGGGRGGVAGGEVAEDDGRAQGDARPRVAVAHDRLHVVADRVEPGDGGAVSAEHLRIGIRHETLRRADVAGVEADRVVRAFIEGSERRVRSGRLRVAEVALVPGR